MKKYTTLLFDLDDTLLDFHRAEREAVEEVLTLCGIRHTEEIKEKYSEINRALWQALERREVTKDELFVLRWERLCEIFGFGTDPAYMSHAYHVSLSKKAYPLDGAIRMCEKLHKKYRMYIVTNGDKFVQEGRLSRCKLPQYFDGCFISEAVGHEKPNVEYFEEIAKQIPDYDPQKTLIIGDSPSSDMQGGVNAGIDTCWFNPKDRALGRDINITYTVHSPAEIEEILCN